MTAAPRRLFAATLFLGAGLLGACDDDSTSPPNVPAVTGVTVSATSPTTARVTFAGVADAVRYDVQRAQGESGGSFTSVGQPTTPVFDDSGLQPNTAYRYRVAAVVRSTSGPFSAEAMVRTPQVVINAPANVQLGTPSSRSVRITFDAVAGATSYVVQRAPGSGGSFAQVGTTTTTSYTDTTVSANTAYRYRVAAVVGGTTGSFSGELAISTPGLPAANLSGDITADRTLHADTVYTLTTFVKVTNGATLRIQPGTVIRGDLGTALFILRGAKIDAQGTAERPIVMTSARNPGERRPGDWGGLILIGNGIINRAAPVILEGTGTGASNPQQTYSGGSDNADNSGTLRYVRIEFAGFGPAQDAELNSLTLAAVGSGTTVEYVQTLAGLDDSFEWFGGAVDAKYLVSYESGDDHFDMSEGYVGRVQYAIAYQSRILQPRPGSGNVSNDPQGIENDGCAGSGCANGQNSTPYTIPLIANFTLVGTGPGVVDATSGGVGMMLRRGTGGYYVNGVVARWPRAAISLRDSLTNVRVQAGDLVLRNLLLAENGPTFQAPSGTTQQFTVDTTANAIQTASGTAASLFAALPSAPANAGAFNWQPAAGSAAATGGLNSFSGALATKAGSFVTATAYRGAAAPTGPRWWEGWTSYSPN